MSVGSQPVALLAVFLPVELWIEEVISSADQHILHRIIALAREIIVITNNKEPIKKSLITRGES